MTKKQELIINDLTKIKKYLEGIKFKGNTPSEPFKHRLCKAYLNNYRYRIGWSRWFLVADFENRTFEIVNNDFFNDGESYKNYTATYPLDITKRDYEWMERDGLVDEFFLYAEGLIERWTSIKSKLTAYIEFEKTDNKLDFLESFIA